MSSPREQGLDALEAVIRVGASMLRAGNTATRTCELIERMALNLGFDTISVALSLDSIAADARRSGQSTAIIRSLGPPGVNVWRIGQLEQLAQSVTPDTAPDEIAARLQEINSAAPLYARAQIATGITLAAQALHSSMASARPRSSQPQPAAGLASCCECRWRTASSIILA